MKPWLLLGWVAMGSLGGCTRSGPDLRLLREEIGYGAAFSEEGLEDRSRWPESVLRLKPLRVYRHRVNLVLVTEQNQTVEQGIYVYLPISSHLPQSDEEWSFQPAAEDVWYYQRRLSSAGTTDF